jgi:hypothetical protein
LAVQVLQILTEKHLSRAETSALPLSGHMVVIPAIHVCEP